MDFDRIDIAGLRRRRGAKWSTCPPELLPAWVADMDFEVAEPITRALEAMVAGSDLGYPSGASLGALAGLFARRMHERYGWQVDPGRVEVLTDVVQGIHMAIDLFSDAGDSVVTPDPIYPPFLEAVRSAPRLPVWKHYEATARGYRVDVERLRAELLPSTRMLLLCNPHNPTGHLLEDSELEALATIAVERDLVVVSDEIHADLVYPAYPVAKPARRHRPFATLGPAVAERTITLTSATKAFNIAGLRCAVAVFGSAKLQQRFARVHPQARGGLGALGVAATAAAWSEGQPWLDEVLRYLQANRDHLTSHAAAQWPAIAYTPPEATYLAWLDCRALGLDAAPQAWFARHGVLLSAGEDFGEGGRGFVRLNFATSRAILTEILGRMDRAVAAAASGASRQPGS